MYIVTAVIIRHTATIAAEYGIMADITNMPRTRIVTSRPETAIHVSPIQYAEIITEQIKIRLYLIMTAIQIKIRPQYLTTAAQIRFKTSTMTIAVNPRML